MSVTIFREDYFGFISVNYLLTRKLAKEYEALAYSLNGFYISICCKCKIICIKKMREGWPYMTKLNRVSKAYVDLVENVFREKFHAEYK